MSDGDALFAAILAHPDDDTLRLVYADWLDEQPGRRVPCPEECVRGDDGVHYEGITGIACRGCGGTGEVVDAAAADRAALIRVQHELSPLRVEADPKRGVFTKPDGGYGYVTPPAFPKWQEIDRRERELLAANPEWSTCPCPACGGTGGFHIPGRGEDIVCQTCGGSGDLLQRLVDDRTHAKGSRVLDWHAGWPRSLSCTLAEAGAVHDAIDGCPTGRRFVPSAWAAAVVAAVPCLRLVPSDREPWTYRIGGERRFSFLQENGPHGEYLSDPRNRLPPTLHAEFVRFAPQKMLTREAAVDALAGLLCSLARGAAPA